MEALQVGDPSSIGPFRLLGRLGDGGMGRVFLGASPGGRKVAVKVIHSHYASDPEFRRRFIREVAAARQVGGFHTAMVVDADPEAESPWMATAYISGQSLADNIKQRGHLDESAVRELGTALAEGLAAIHACGLIHRDLKPSNIIVADDGPRIIDFGIARGVDESVLTTSNAVVGTLRYMSPEQLRDQEVTAQSDVFALGAVLAQAATGHDAFEAETLPAVIAHILTDPPNLEPLTGELRDIIASCLAKEPADRPTPSALLARLAGLPAPEPPRSAATAPPRVPGLNVVTPPTVTIASTEAVASTRAKRRVLLAAAGSVVVLGVAVGLGALLLNGHSSGHPKSTATPSASAFPATVSTADGSMAATLTGAQGSGFRLAAFGPGDEVITGDPGGDIYIWSAATKRLTATLADPSSKGIGSLATESGGVLATGDGNGETYLWNLVTRQRTASFASPTGGGIWAMCFGPNGLLAAGNSNGNIDLWNTETRQHVSTLSSPQTGGAIDTVAFGPNGLLATGNTNGQIYLWNSASGQLITTLTDPSGGNVWTVAFGPNGLLAASGSTGHTYLWKTTTDNVVAELTDPYTTGVDEVAFGPGGILVVGDVNGDTYLWNTATRKPVTTLVDGDNAYVDAVAVAGDGAIVTRSDNGDVYLWKMTYR